MRYLLVGLGNIGRKRQVELGSRCVATVDPANQAADFRDARETAGVEYDAAILSVPTAAKLPLAMHFLGQGTHLLVDKPLLFDDRAQADRLLALSAEHGAACVTSYNHRHEPALAKLKALIEAGALGRLYHGRLHYGNGTVRNLVGSWRDAGLGVLEDLASHLIDLASYLFPQRPLGFEVVDLRSCELEAPDHGLLRSIDGALQLEVSFLAWKNSFGIDLFGELGSLHLSGLQKWQGSQLIWRKRVLPSGAPTEQRFEFSGEDLSWAADLQAFEQAVRGGGNTIEHDWRISEQLTGLLL